MLHSRAKLGTGLTALCLVLGGCAMESEPLSQAERDQRMVTDLRLIRAMEFVPAGPITLNEAIARSVAFNLERRVKEIEREITDAELQTKSYDMLPSLDLNAARNSTNRQLSSTDDPLTRTASAGVTWNVLDLGVSYARAKQQADKVQVARENERKALQDIVRQVRTAYWRAVGAQRLIGKVEAVSQKIKVAMRESRAMERAGANDVIKSVAYRREIVESVRQALSVQRELRDARAELGELLNIRPGTPFTLAATTLEASMPTLPMSLPDMEKHALDNRPELRVEDYNERMSEWQAREALFDMLPGLKMTTATNYSSDAFNLTSNWISTGFQLGMNLFGLFSGASRMDEADKRGELARRQRLAMTLAVMTQTHLAYIQFSNASQQMRLAREVARADRRLATLVASDAEYVNTDYFEAVQLATRQLQSEADEYRAQVELITAHSEVMHAIGLDVFPEEIRTGNLAALTDEIGRITAKWETRGEISVPPPVDTPLDQLVNAMLLGGEQAPEPERAPRETREARAPDAAPDLTAAFPPEFAGDPAVLNAVESAGGLAKTPEMPVSAEIPPMPEMPAMPEMPPVLHAALLTGEPVLSDSEVPPPPADVPLPAVGPPAPAGDDPLAGFTEILPGPAEVAVASAATPQHVVQLGVFRADAKARRLKRRLTEAPGAALHGVDVWIVERRSNAGETLHYVETAAIPDRSTARDLCATLKGLGEDCVAVTR